MPVGQAESSLSFVVVETGAERGVRLDDITEAADVGAVPGCRRVAYRCTTCRRGASRSRCRSASDDVPRRATSHAGLLALDRALTSRSGGPGQSIAANRRGAAGSRRT